MAAVGKDGGACLWDASGDGVEAGTTAAAGPRMAEVAGAGWWHASFPEAVVGSMSTPQRDPCHPQHISERVPLFYIR